MAGPLEGVKVVEFTEIIAGPFAGMLLADMGAEVIKVEPPWGDPWRGTQPFSATESRPFIAYNRGKRSITLDLTSGAAGEILARLIPQMDVAIVNYRPDVAAKLGVDYEALAALNPRLIYCENTAFGRQGPDAYRPGYDLILQAMSGIMTAESKVSNGAPVHVVSSPMVDTAAGICLAWCVCAALYHRERTGQGQKVETTLLGLALALLGMRFVEIEALDRERFEANAGVAGGAAGGRGSLPGTAPSLRGGAPGDAGEHLLPELSDGGRGDFAGVPERPAAAAAVGHAGADGHPV